VVEEKSPQIKVLIVDDDKSIAEVLEGLISNNERTVHVCHDGVSALERIEKHPYDLILSDLIMPKVGGLEILKYAKKINPEIIVVLLTGYASLETAIEAIREGAYDYIRKPCKLEEIEIVVKNAIEKIKLNRENRELLKKLQDAYHELIELKKETCEEKISSINFFSSNMPNLQTFNKGNTSPDRHIDQLEILSSLKENGNLTENEFEVFKEHLIKNINKNE
jgi:DNA-binding NtrC family response regulator